MRKLLRKIDRSLSFSHESKPAVQRRLSLPLCVETSLLYSCERNGQEQVQNGPNGANGIPQNGLDSHYDVDGASIRSVALSESDTLALAEPRHFELQHAYQDNYTAYLPFLLRRLRVEQGLAASNDIAVVNAEVSEDSEELKNDDLDEEKTVASEVEDVSYIMGRPMTTYNAKRSLVVVSEFIKGVTYVFPCAESYDLFKELKLGKQKLRRKNSVIVYDNNHNISRVTGANPESLPVDGSSDTVVDRRQHIVPVENKIKGAGLPLFKITVPYMSTFRRKAPFMVFRKYKEIPEKPELGPGAESDDSFETYSYCHIHTKMVQSCKRYAFLFTPEGCEPFTVFAFQNNNRPFTDFNYKDTRFRVLGTLLLLAYAAAYNPELKLFILDEGQALLADDTVEKESRPDIFTRVRLGSLSHSTSRNGAEILVPPEFPSQRTSLPVNPVPRSDNPIILDNESHSRASGQTFIPNNSPPFSRFVDSLVYQKSALFLPKRYSEEGKVEVYQDPDLLGLVDPLTTYAVDTDSLVITTILLALREANIRMAKRQHNLSSRISVFNSYPSLGGSLFFGAAMM